MLASEQIQSLKRTNVSTNYQKTQQRITELWKSLNNKQKQVIRDCAGVTAQTIYRVQNTGNISAKLVIAFAQTLNLDPYYLTGEADEQGECTNALLYQLLEQHGYKELAAEIAPPKAKRPYRRKAKAMVEETAPEPEAEQSAADEPKAQTEESPAEEEMPIVDIDLPEEDLQALLHSLVILSKAGIAVATEKLGQIKSILIS